MQEKNKKFVCSLFVCITETIKQKKTIKSFPISILNT